MASSDPNDSGGADQASPYLHVGASREPDNYNDLVTSDVGTLLCATRMRMGRDLQQIAAVLHIRYNYLVAIEDGRYEDLPGQAYAIGFVRAYADHLGLDGNEIVRRYKEESAGIRRKTSFEFPLTPPDTGLPSGALLLVSIVVGMVVYGAWYSIAGAERGAIELIQEVPNRLTALLDEEGTSSQPEQTEYGILMEPAIEEASPESGDAVDAVEPAVEDVEGAASDVAQSQPAAAFDGGGQVSTPASQPSPEEPVRSNAAQPAQGPSTPAPGSVGPEPNPAEATVSSAAPTTSASNTAPEAEEAESSSEEADRQEPRQTASDSPGEDETAATDQDTEESGSAESTANSTSSIEPDDSPEEATVPQTEEGASEGQASQTAGTEGTSEGSGEGDVVELRAKADSWIQLRDGEELLLTRLLRKGEVYRVPERGGLTLMTGNAGGLEVLVNGKVMPPIGNEGSVARGVPLDPKRLQGGE